jgi:hypothetical protein
MDDDDTDAALAHQQELEARRWQEELTNDAGYLAWLADLAAEAASRTKVNYGDHG